MAETFERDMHIGIPVLVHAERDRQGKRQQQGCAKAAENPGETDGQMFGQRAVGDNLGEGVGHFRRGRNDVGVP